MARILLIVDAESEETIHARLAAGPWTPMGVPALGSSAVHVLVRGGDSRGLSCVSGERSPDR